MSISIRFARSVLLVVSALSTACGAPDSRAAAPTPAPGAAPQAAPPRAASHVSPPPAWPSELEQQALLIADRIEIEGPPGLIAHVAMQQVPGEIDYRIETTRDGLLQTWEARTGLEIRGQLDNTVLAAVRRVSVLERFAAAAVVVRASGSVYYKQGLTETRVPTWSRTYPLPEPAAPTAPREPQR
jgi:hypothetical protein